MAILFLSWQQAETVDIGTYDQSVHKSYPVIGNFSIAFINLSLILFAFHVQDIIWVASSSSETWCFEFDLDNFICRGGEWLHNASFFQWVNGWQRQLRWWYLTLLFFYMIILECSKSCLISIHIFLFVSSLKASCAKIFHPLHNTTAYSNWHSKNNFC